MNRLHHQSVRAFTLIELVFITAVAAIACAIILPHWSNSVQNYQLTLAARRIAADLAWAQSYANTTSSTVSVTFDFNSGKYQLSGIPDPDRPSQAYTVDLTGDPYHVRLVTSVNGVTSTTIAFNGYGVPTQTGSVTVASGTSQKSILVDPTTGQTSIQ